MQDSLYKLLKDKKVADSYQFIHRVNINYILLRQAFRHCRI